MVEGARMVWDWLSHSFAWFSAGRLKPARIARDLYWLPIWRHAILIAVDRPVSVSWQVEFM